MFARTECLLQPSLTQIRNSLLLLRRYIPDLLAYGYFTLDAAKLELDDTTRRGRERKEESQSKRETNKGCDFFEREVFCDSCSCFKVEEVKH